MSMRSPVKVKKDQSIFKHTAVKTKSVNLYQTVKRGGIRF